jgi:hypothetical protein
MASNHLAEKPLPPHEWWIDNLEKEELESV